MDGFDQTVNVKVGVFFCHTFTICRGEKIPCNTGKLTTQFAHQAMISISLRHSSFSLGYWVDREQNQHTTFNQL